MRRNPEDARVLRLAHNADSCGVVLYAVTGDLQSEPIVTGVFQTTEDEGSASKREVARRTRNALDAIGRAFPKLRMVVLGRAPNWHDHPRKLHQLVAVIEREIQDWIRARKLHAGEMQLERIAGALASAADARAAK